MQLWHKIAKTTSPLQNYNAGGASHTFYAGDSPVSIANQNLFQYMVLLKCLSAQSLSTQQVQVTQIFANITNSTAIYITAVRTQNNDQMIRWVQYTIIIFDIIAYSGKRIANYVGNIHCFSNIVLNTSYLVEDAVLDNFGIGDFFVNNQLGGYQEFCVIGFISLMVGGSIATPGVRGMMFDSGISPMVSIASELITVNGTQLQFYAASYRAICLKHCPTNQYYLTGNKQCLPCTANCYQCTSDTDCSSCLSGYFLTVLNTCVTCNSSMSNCLTCEVDVMLNEYNCTSCEAPFVLNDNLCVNCSNAISGCSSCDNNTYCSICASDNFGYSTNQSQCVTCSQLFDKCWRCTNYQCNFCQDGYLLKDGVCQCQVGFLVSNMCTTVVGCTSQVDYGNGFIQCTQCNTTYFQITPVNGICACLNGYSLVNDVCNSVLGCLSPEMSSQGHITCLYCNQSAQFQNVPDSSGNCICKSKYQLKSTICVQICGDGFLMDSSLSACDDGNTIDGDGCSSICQVEAEYQCLGGSSTSPSSCVYQGIPLAFQLQATTHSEGLNQGVFTFSISPPLKALNQMDFKSYLVLACNSTYSVVDVTYKEGKFDVTVDYTEDMENRTCNLTLSFDQSLISSQSKSMVFLVQGDDIALLYYSKIKQYQQIKFIFEVLSYAALVLLAVSLPTKVIGVQLISCCQLIYLSYCLYQRPSFMFNSLQGFHLVTGYWSLFGSNDYSYLPSFTDRLRLGSSFLDNSFIIVISLLFFTLLFLMLIFATSCSETKVDQSKVTNSSRSFLKLGRKIVYNWFIFPLTIGFLIVLSLSAFVGSFRLTDDKTFSDIFQSLSIGFIWLITGCVSSTEIFYEDKDKSKISKRWYIAFLILKMLILVVLFEVSIYLQFLSKLKYVLVVYEIIIVVFICWSQPYYLILHNLGLIFCQCAFLYAIALSFVGTFYQLTEDMEVFVLFILEGVLILLFLFTLIRVVKVYYESIKNMLKKEETEDEQSINKVQNKKQQCEKEDLKQVEELNKYSLFKRKNPFFRPQVNNQRKVEELEQEELKRLKQKLRQNLILTRKKNRNIQYQEEVT